MNRIRHSIHTEKDGLYRRYLRLHWAICFHQVVVTCVRRILQCYIKSVCGSGGIRTHAPEETGALNQRLRPLGHATHNSPRPNLDTEIFGFLIEDYLLHKKSGGEVSDISKDTVLPKEITFPLSK